MLQLHSAQIDLAVSLKSPTMKKLRNSIYGFCLSSYNASKINEKALHRSSTLVYNVSREYSLFILEMNHGVTRNHIIAPLHLTIIPHIDKKACHRSLHPSFICYGYIELLSIMNTAFCIERINCFIKTTFYVKTAFHKGRQFY